MYHAVNSAEIDKCAVACERLNGAGIFLTFFNLSPESFGRGLAFFSDN